MTDTYHPMSPYGMRARLNHAVHSLSLTGRLVFYILATIFIVSTLSLLWSINSYFMVEVPARGGTLTEGVLGLPRYVNPVLAITEGDKDITALVYSGLMRELPTGDLTPDLAESYTVSDDGKIYTFTLRKNIFFHDGKPVTADDVVFTISQIQNPAIKSPKRINWDGILAEKVDDRTVRFTLKQPYAPFLENTTVGILPRGLWSATTAEAFALSDRNIDPVGSGPYKMKSIKKNSGGIPTSYTLEANKKFVFGIPSLSTVVFNFYPTESALEDAFKNGDIDSIHGISPTVAVEYAKRGAAVYTAPLPRVFGVYFNQSENEALASADVRRALDMSVNREYIVDTVLQGFGTTLTGPMPQSFVGTSPSQSTSTPEDRINRAIGILEKAGWKLNENGIREKKTDKGTTTLAFSVSTSDAPELKNVADIIRAEWRKIGADVTVKVFEGGSLNQDIIRPRKYEALLFGQIVNRDFDLYAFWHSSQRTDPGLNIALYSNKKVDSSLEIIRTTGDSALRLGEYQKIATEIASDVPAVFLYSPNLIYVTSPRIRNIVLNTVETPSDRFATLYTWYMNTDHVWKVFTHTK